MPDLSTSIREYYDAAAEPVDIAEILARSEHRRVVPNWGVAVAAGLAVFVLIGGFVWLVSGTSSEVIEEPMPTVVATTTATIPDETPVSVPDTAPLIRVDPEQVASGLPVDATNAVAVGDGSLWVWTGLGIVRWDLEGRDAELFGSADGLPFADGASGRIAVAPDGTVWASTWNQDLARFDGTRWSEPDGYDQLDIVNPRCIVDEDCQDPITAMAVSPDGVLSLAVGEETLLQFDGTEWNVLPVSEMETHDGSAWTTDMAVAANGTLWVASWEELLAYDGDEWDRFTTVDGLPSGWIGSVAVAPNGDVWIGTNDRPEEDGAGGVARFDGDSWTVFGEADGLYNSATTALTVGPDGTVWAIHGAVDDPGFSEEPAEGAVSRFDGTTWSSVTIADLGFGFGWGEVAVDDTGTLWITSRLGIVGLNGSEATVLRFPEGTRQPINAAPFTVPSQILPADEGPIEWRWGPLDSGTSEKLGVEEPVWGEGCYGSGGSQVPSTLDDEFNGGSIGFEFGYGSTPDIVVTDEGGTVTNVGNPFGEEAWLCSVAATDTHLLAVGSGVWWSTDGIAWNGIEAFEESAGWNIDGSNLMWAAAGPGGYMVLGRTERQAAVVWYSEDLRTWYEAPLENEGYGSSIWGWVGPVGVAVGEEVVIAMFDDGWIGTRSR
jgi:hypothetical protein